MDKEQKLHKENEIYEIINF